MRLNLTITRAVASPLFIIGGGCLTLASLLGAPSFWYIPCTCALIPLGFAWWLCRPSLAAALSVGPLVAVAALLRYLKGAWFATLAACLIIVVILIFVALRNSRGWTLPLFVSLLYLAVAFCTDRLFTNKLTVKAFEMGIALDGKAHGATSPRIGKMGQPQSCCIAASEQVTATQPSNQRDCMIFSRRNPATQPRWNTTFSAISDTNEVTTCDLWTAFSSRMENR